MFQPGEHIHGYRVEAQVATGSMGIVYRVVHVARGTTHALKYLPLASADQQARVRREAANLQRLSHPNVVSLTEVLEIDGRPGLIMEYVEGPTLADWMHEHHSPRTIEQLFLGIIKGVAHAHQHGVVHRDLNPANVLLAETPNGLLPKVADFGLSKLESPPVGAASITSTDVAIGAEGYKAPEQITDPRNVDARADIFSLGCLLYEACCGVPVFGGADPLERMNAVKSGRYTSPHQHRPDLPDRFVWAIEGCLRPNIMLRLPTCEALLSVLGEGSAMTPIAAPSRGVDPTASIVEPTPPRSQGAIMAVAALLVVVVGALLAYVLA